jgi:hypothetical protein
VYEVRTEYSVHVTNSQNPGLDDATYGVQANKGRASYPPAPDKHPMCSVGTEGKPGKAPCRLFRHNQPQAISCDIAGTTKTARINGKARNDYTDHINIQLLPEVSDNPPPVNSWHDNYLCTLTILEHMPAVTQPRVLGNSDGFIVFYISSILGDRAITTSV